jgi:hypothetical protein
MTRLHKIRGLFLLEINRNASCPHPHIMLNKETGETICVECRRPIYMKRRPNDLLGDNTLGQC